VVKTLKTVSRLFIAIAMIAFGVQQIIYQDFVTRVFPKLPRWIPGHAFLTIVFGVFLIVGGVAMAARKATRQVALLLGGVILISFAVLYVPWLIASPLSGGTWTNSGKALALAGGSLLVAGSVPAESAHPTALLATITKALERLIPLGRFFLAAFLVLTGILHFIYVEFVASLVPSWIPAHLFWTYLPALH